MSADPPAGLGSLSRNVPCLAPADLMADPPRHRRTGQPSSGRQPWEQRPPGATPPPGRRPDGRAPAPPGRGAPPRRPATGGGGSAGSGWGYDDDGRDRRAGGTGGGREQPGRSARGQGDPYDQPARSGRGQAPRGGARPQGGARAPQGGQVHLGAPGQTGDPYDPYGYGGGRGGTGGRGSGAGTPPPGRRKRRRTWPQRFILGVGGLIVGMSLLAASVAGYTLVKYQSIDRLDDLDTPQAAAGQPENYLIVAVDTREGQGSINTDTIMVVRIDPQSDRVALTSFNRDLMVTIADTGRTGMINAAYNRPDGTGAQNLINTIKQNFDVDINHFIAVDFQSFQKVVDAVGGVEMFFPYAVRDQKSGLHQYDLGCVTMNGEQGLAYARARHFQIMTQDGWETDPTSDLGRVQRQQIFIQRAMAKALSQVKSNPLRLRELLDIGVSSVTLDPNLTISDMLKLAEHFQSFDSGKLEAYALPTLPYPQESGRLLLDEAGAEEFLNVFRGVPPGDVRPGLIDVSVLNGTQGQNETLAGDTSAALQQVGFDLEAPQDADELYENSVVHYAPGQLAYGQRVARHLTSPVELREDPELASGHVRLIAGLDFTTVHQDPAPVESLAPPIGADGEQVTTTTAPPASDTTATTIPPPSTTTTEPTGYVVGAPPEGQEC